MNFCEWIASLLDGDRDLLHRELSSTRHRLQMARDRNNTLHARCAELERENEQLRGELDIVDRLDRETSW